MHFLLFTWYMYHTLLQFIPTVVVLLNPCDIYDGNILYLCTKYCIPLNETLDMITTLWNNSIWKREVLISACLLSNQNSVFPGIRHVIPNGDRFTPEKRGLRMINLRICLWCVVICVDILILIWRSSVVIPVDTMPS